LIDPNELAGESDELKPDEQGESAIEGDNKID